MLQRAYSTNRDAQQIYYIAIYTTEMIFYMTCGPHIVTTGHRPCFTKYSIRRVYDLHSKRRISRHNK
jgi:hypothetical protein